MFMQMGKKNVSSLVAFFFLFLFYMNKKKNCYRHLGCGFKQEIVPPAVWVKNHPKGLVWVSWASRFHFYREHFVVGVYIETLRINIKSCAVFFFQSVQE